MEEERKPQFGTRYLTNEEDVWKHNSWDQVEWDLEMLANAQAQVEANSSVTMSKEEADNYLNNSSTHWDKFYENHESKFFKDRHWLQLEFPELMKGREESRLRLLEVGCGVGNAIFPLLDENPQSALEVFGCDHSAVAIDVLKKNPTYTQFQHQIHAFVCDITDESQLVETFSANGIAEESLDLIILVFVLSALRPEYQMSVVRSLSRYLKPGGVVLFRDYGRFDMAQLRFKPGQCLDKNLYLRRDGTTSYFFTLEEVEKCFMTDATCPENPVFTKAQLMEDRRLIVNRARRLQMYRSWIQARFIKKECATLTTDANSQTI